MPRDSSVYLADILAAGFIACEALNAVILPLLVTTGVVALPW